MNVFFLPLGVGRAVHRLLPVQRGRHTKCSEVCTGREYWLESGMREVSGFVLCCVVLQRISQMEVLLSVCRGIRERS